MPYEVVEDFEPRGRESRYLPLADAKTYKVTLTETGHRTEKNLSMALRSFAKRKHLDAKIQTGQGYVIVRMTPKF
jgi:hypothetical protein